MIAQIDVELATIQMLRATPGVTALVPAASITTQLPPNPMYPHVLIQRASGQMLTWVTIDAPVVQVDVMGTTQGQASRAMLAVRAAILGLASTVVPEGVLESATEQIGPSWLPDTVSVPPVPRYTAHFEIITRPL